MSKRPLTLTDEGRLSELVEELEAPDNIIEKGLTLERKYEFKRDRYRSRLEGNVDQTEDSTVEVLRLDFSPKKTGDYRIDINILLNVKRMRPESEATVTIELFLGDRTITTKFSRNDDIERTESFVWQDYYPLTQGDACQIVITSQFVDALNILNAAGEPPRVNYKKASIIVEDLVDDFVE